MSEESQPESVSKSDVASGTTKRRQQVMPSSVGDAAFFDRVSKAPDSVTFQLTCDPRVLPGNPNDQTIRIPLGRGYYWESTSPNEWSHDYTNWGYYGASGTTQASDDLHWCTIPEANPGCLVSRAGSDDNFEYFSYYEENLDRSIGGTAYYKNNYAPFVDLDFYINDRLNHYGDNIGFMNHKLVVFVIPVPDSQS